MFIGFIPAMAEHSSSSAPGPYHAGSTLPYSRVEGHSFAPGLVIDI